MPFSLSGSLNAERQRQTEATIQQQAEYAAEAERQANGARNQTSHIRSDAGRNTSSSGGDSGAARGVDGEAPAGEQLLAAIRDPFGAKSSPSPHRAMATYSCRILQMPALRIETRMPRAELSVPVKPYPGSLNHRDDMSILGQA